MVAVRKTLTATVLAVFASAPLGIQHVSAAPDPYVQIWGRYPHPDPYVRAHGSYPHTSYLGEPDLRLALALVDAGGGPAKFDAARLMNTLGGPHASAEIASLKNQYGGSNVRSFFSTFSYAVKDTLEFVKTAKLRLPASPAPNPADGKALSAALYRSGVMPNGKFDCGYMMEHLMSRPGHVQVMKDINGNRSFGPNANANFHIILTKAVKDLKSAYGL